MIKRSNDTVIPVWVGILSSVRVTDCSTDTLPNCPKKPLAPMGVTSRFVLDHSGPTALSKLFEQITSAPCKAIWADAKTTAPTTTACANRNFMAFSLRFKRYQAAGRNASVILDF